MEKAFRSMGMFDAATRARLKFEATEAAVAAGFGHVQDCEWYDRGVSEMPYIYQSAPSAGVIVYFGAISVALQPDQVRRLWALITLAMFPNRGEAVDTILYLVKSDCYDEEGYVQPAFYGVVGGLG